MLVDDKPIMPEKLLLSVAEQLKLPLLQIARRSELADLRGEALDAKGTQATAEAALRLIDSYVLGVQLAEAGQEHIVLEPVSVSAVLYDAAQQLDRMARFYGVKLELHVDGRYGTVLAHRQGLQAAFTSLSMALIEALPALDSEHVTLHFMTHRSRYGIVAGVYSDIPNLNTALLKRGNSLLGKSRQPLVGLTHSSGAGVFVAESILQTLQLRLVTTRHQHMRGLGTILQPNKQLQLV